jgi:hypothetical protein
MFIVCMYVLGDGSIKLIDLRAPSENAPVYKCHKRSIRTVQSNPMDDNYFLTSSGTGCVTFSSCFKV